MRQVREFAQWGNVGDRVVANAPPDAAEVEAGQASEILNPHQARDPEVAGIQLRQPSYQAAGKILLRADRECSPDRLLQVAILERRDGIVGVIGARLAGLKDRHYGDR